MYFAQTHKVHERLQKTFRRQQDMWTYG